MAKRSYKEKDTWKKKRRQEYLEKKEFRYYIFCEASRRNHHILKDLNVILRKGIEIYLAKYKNFDWINCTNEELQDARSNVTRLLNLAQKIEKEFKRV